MRRISAPFTLEERQTLSHRVARTPIICPDVAMSYHRESPFRTTGALVVTADGLICGDCGYTKKTLQVEDD